jgi:hypothetical protein
MEQPQRAQRLDQRQLAPIELRVALVAGEQIGELPLALGARAGQQQPQILHRRSHAALLETHQRAAAVVPAHVAGMQVAVHADQAPPPHAASSAAAATIAPNGIGNLAGQGWAKPRASACAAKARGSTSRSLNAPQRVVIASGDAARKRRGSRLPSSTRATIAGANSDAGDAIRLATR